MTHESDPRLDALRAAWAEESRVPSMPSESLARSDASTRAVVGALTNAWQAEAAMNAEAAESALRKRRRGIRRRRIATAAWAGLGLAAAAALFMVLPSAWPSIGPSALERGGAASQAGAERELALESAPQLPAGFPADSTPPATAQVQQITQRPDGVEFRSGGVRVVLVQPMR